MEWFKKPKPTEGDLPLVVARLSHFPEANLHGFAIELENRPGSLLLVIQQISAEYLNIIATEASGKPKDRTCALYIVVDFTGMVKSPNQLMEKLQKVSTVISVREVEPIVPGYLVDTAHFPLWLPEEKRFIILCEVMVQSFFQGAYDSIGKDASKLFLYHIGLAWGTNLASMIKETVKIAGEDVLRVLLARGKAFGWWDGRGEANLQSNLLTIRLWHNLEGVYTKKWQTGCHLTRGIWDGALSEISGRKLQTIETSCISKGNENCEFRLEPVEQVKIEV